MSQTPPRDEATLDRETRSSDELERALATVHLEKPKTEDTITPPPPKRRCDSAHREIPRHPFSLE